VSMITRPPTSTLFPYTTLFRSMRRTVTYPFLALGIFLFLWINLPQNMVDFIRSAAVVPFHREAVPSSSTDLARLQIENQKLRSRSEEHTSELQSRENLVCRLLL